MEKDNKIPVLVITDIGRDVDDALAISYLHGSQKMFPAGIVTTKMIPEKRAAISRFMCNALGNLDIPIGAGSVYSINNEDPVLLQNYLQQTQIDGVSFEGEGILPPGGYEYGKLNIEDPEKIIQECLEEYGSRLVIALLAPPTDLAKLILKERKKFENIEGIYAMGLAENKSGLLVPHMKSYNFRMDQEGSKILFSLQDKVKFTLLSKFAAYSSPLTKNNFKNFSDTGHPVGQYLTTHANKVLECSLKGDPYVLRRILKIPEDADLLEAYKNSQYLSNPYDPFTVMAIGRPELFQGVDVGGHTIIGESLKNHGVKSTEESKKELIEGICRALNN